MAQSGHQKIHFNDETNGIAAIGNAFALQGEIARLTRSVSSQGVSTANDVELGGISLHSQALLVTKMFGQNLSDQNFVKAEKAFIPVLFEDEIGRKVAEV